MFNKPKLAVVDVTSVRPENPAYQDLGNKLRDSFLNLAAKDWQVELLISDSLGADGLIEKAADADAVVILGGEDVSPSFYRGNADYPGSGTHNPAADAAQIALVQHNLNSKKATLGICRGNQLINVALGGNLVQHIESGAHRNANILNDLKLVTHDVSVDSGTRLGAALSDSNAKVSVQSSHHQAIGELASGLRVVAKAEDGIIEAIEHETAPIYGVQWHPEDPDTSADGLYKILDFLRGEAQEKAAER